MIKDLINQYFIREYFNNPHIYLQRFSGIEHKEEMTYGSNCRRSYKFSLVIYRYDIPL
ncbi:MAG: hypothetical protein ACFFA2_13225 [Promethearchaeota archaeon]